MANEQQLLPLALLESMAGAITWNQLLLMKRTVHAGQRFPEAEVGSSERASHCLLPQRTDIHYVTDMEQVVTSWPMALLL
jgi:hypothetical protein